MEMLAHDERVIFLGQAVGYQGTSMSATVGRVPMPRRIEMPVAEEMQMGISLGLSIAGFVPVTFYPRFNFLMLAVNQLVNHVDKIAAISHGVWPGRVIIRVGVGSERPLHPGHQHVGDFSEAFRMLVKNTQIFRVLSPARAVPAYQAALAYNGPSLVVEYGDYYAEK
jgi:pyruvate/2-oxoglutarate/acetoin dehydrogenase E1 component